MTGTLEIIIVMVAIAVALAYLIYTVFLPAFKKSKKNVTPGCSDDCGCDAKEKISELKKK